MATAKGKNAAKAAAKTVEETEDTDQSYDNLAKVSWGNIKKEQLLPEGTWRLKFRGGKRMQPKEGSDNSPRLVLFLNPIAPLEDVDVEALAELGEDYDFGINKATWSQWLSENSDYSAVLDVFEKAGIDVEAMQEENIDFDDSIKLLRGKTICGYLKVDNYNPDKPQLVVSAFSVDEEA